MKMSLPVIIVGLFISQIVLGSNLDAQTLSTHSPTTNNNKPFEDIQFIGPFGAEDEKKPKQDTFTFKDGKFSTGSCLEWGFKPAPYWVRRDDKGIHFLAELESREHGTMRYEGTYDGKKLTVVGFWKKERWYWTMKATYRGHGVAFGLAN